MQGFGLLSLLVVMAIGVWFMLGLWSDEPRQTDEVPTAQEPRTAPAVSEIGGILEAAEEAAGALGN
jgi:hypothetical protein